MVDWENLRDWGVAEHLTTPAIAAGPGPPFPAATDEDFRLAEVLREEARNELSRRGYSDDEIRRIEGGDLTGLHWTP